MKQPPGKNSNNIIDKEELYKKYKYVNHSEDSVNLVFRQYFETFRINNPDAMAITICPILMASKPNAVEQHRDIRCKLNRILFKSCFYMLVPEFRDTDNSIHYHGYINVFKKIQYKRNTLNSLRKVGFYKIKKKPNKDWSIYCTKEAYINYPLITPWIMKCGPYLSYNCHRVLFKNDDERIERLVKQSKKKVAKEMKRIKQEAQNILLNLNFGHLLFGQ